MPKHANSIDVARLAGVSQTTVSFVLNDRPNHAISPETRQRVIDAAKQLSYRSNRLSNGLFRGSTGLVGVVMPLVTEDYYANILSSISSTCASKGRTVVFSPLEAGHPNKLDPLNRLIEYRVDGIILVCQESIVSELNDWLPEVIEKHIRCVVVDDHRHQSVVPCIVSDDITASQDVVSYLASLGHRRIAHLSAGDDSTTSIDRRLGFVSGMAKIGVPEQDLIIEGRSYIADDARIAATKIMASNPRPTAVFAASDLLASEVVKEARRIGLRCPEELSVVGYGNTRVSTVLDLTTVDQQPWVIGKKSIEQLLRLSEPREESGAEVIECNLIVRNSSGLAPKTP